MLFTVCRYLPKPLEPTNGADFALVVASDHEMAVVGVNASEFSFGDDPHAFLDQPGEGHIRNNSVDFVAGRAFNCFKQRGNCEDALRDLVETNNVPNIKYAAIGEDFLTGGASMAAFKLFDSYIKLASKMTYLHAWRH